jgi:hypothetical protein
LTRKPDTARPGAPFSFVPRATAPEPIPARRRFHSEPTPKEHPMKGIIAWLLGVPLVVIIILYMTNIF